MPKKDKAVSMWLGRMDSAVTLERYLKAEFSEEGNLIPSKFANDFAINDYDEDFREALFHKAPPHSIAEMLARFSYDTWLAEQFLDLIPPALVADVNAIIVLYNFEYNSEPREATGIGVKTMRFVGTVTLRQEQSSKRISDGGNDS